MPIITELLMAHSLQGLNVINKPNTTFRAWVQNSRFNITNDIESKLFTLDVYSHDELIVPFANDINRMATSALETVSMIHRDEKFPKSIGWAMIKLYYASYFSAHAIMRFFAVSCSQFDNNESNAIKRVAELFGTDNGKNISTGFYHCSYIREFNTIVCEQLSNTHQSFWIKFDLLLDELCEKVAFSNFLKNDRDDVVMYLISIRDRLKWKNTSTASWLSKTRNEVNYAHSHGVWYPYNESTKDHDEIYRLISGWSNEPMINDLSNPNNKSDAVIFSETCLAIVKLMKGITEEVRMRGNAKFLDYGPISYLNLCKAS